MKLEDLITSYVPDMYSTAVRLTGSKEAAEDLVHDLFVNLKEKSWQVDHVTHPRAWLGSILYRMYVDRWRRERRSPVVFIGGKDNDKSFGLEDFADQGPGPLQALENDEAFDDIESAMQQLSEDYRQVLLLHDIEGYTIAELHIMMKVPVGTLKSRIHRGREKLLQLLKAEVSDDNEYLREAGS